MPIPRSRRHVARRFAWLLWLGLLLPVAQLAAATHALSHARQAATRDEPNPQAPHLAHCDLCLTAAAIGGAAPAGPVAAIVVSSSGSTQPDSVADTPHDAAPILAYRSRSPPPVAS